MILFSQNSWNFKKSISLFKATLLTLFYVIMLNGHSQEGCTLNLACNYDPSAIIDDGSCQFPGCTDSEACNYSPEAGCDSGSCVYVANCSNFCIDSLERGTDFSAYYNPLAWAQNLNSGNGEIDFNIGYLHITGNSNGISNISTEVFTNVIIPGQFSFDWEYYSLDGPSDELAFYRDGIQIGLVDTEGGNLQSGSISFYGSPGSLLGFSLESIIGNEHAGELLITNFHFHVFDCGCKDPWACNYTPSATLADFDLCEYDYGCTDITACNFDPNASCDSGSCEYETDSCTSDCLNEEGHGVDFQEHYHADNWTYDLGSGNGTINQEIGILSIVGDNNSGSPDEDIHTKAVIEINQTGLHSFDWCYFTEDGPFYDKAFIIIANDTIELTNPLGTQQQFGSYSFEANAGDLISLGINSTDGCCGRGSVNFTSFEYAVDNCCCEGDADGDLEISILDLLAVSANFGCTDCELGDANCDGIVNIIDMLSVSANYGGLCD